jgi:hypothetical protein
LGTAQTELVQGDALEIQRIYVLDFKGKKIGQLLLMEAIAIAQSKKSRIHLVRRLGKQS